MANTIGFGIVGTGVIYREHATALNTLGGAARLVGIAELDEKRRREASSQAFAPVATADYRELLDRTDIDVICVCTPPASHPRIVHDALEAGKYVVCEKPLANTLAEADTMVQHAEQFPGKLSTVYQLRYIPEMQRIKWLQDQGYLGDVLYAHCSRLSSLAGTSGEKGGWWGNWQTAGGGVVMTQYIHHLDQLCYLLGTPVQVEATLGTVKHPIESEDSFGASILFESGALATCGATVAAQNFEYRLDVIGAEMSVHLPWSLRCADTGKLRSAQRAVGREVPLSKMPTGTSLKDKVLRKLGLKLKLVKPPPPMHAGYMQKVVEAVQRQQPLPIGPAEGRRSLELCVAIYTAGITGQRVNLPLGEDCPFYHGVTADAYTERFRTGQQDKQASAPAAQSHSTG